MRTFWRLQYEIQPRPTQDAVGCLDEIGTRLTDWIGSIYQQMALRHVRPDFDGLALRPVPGHFVRADKASHGRFCSAKLLWRFPDKEQPVFWRLHVRLASDGKLVQMAQSVHAELRPFRMNPFKIQLPANNPLSRTANQFFKFLDGHDVARAGQPLHRRPLLLRANHMRQFLDQTLFSAGRTVPVVLMPHSPFIPLFDAHVAGLQEQVFGLAQVAILENATAVRSLAQMAGDGLACVNGLRIYYPALMPNSPASASPFFSFSGLYGNGFVKILGRIHGALLEMGVARAVPGQVLHKAARAVANSARPVERLPSTLRKRFRALEKDLYASWLAQQRLAAERKSAGERIAELENELSVARRLLGPAPAEPQTAPVASLQDQFLDNLIADVDSLRAEKQAAELDLAQAQARMAELEAELADHRTNWSAIWQTETSSEEVADRAEAMHTADRNFASVSEALRAAATDFGDVMIVWESALESAEQSPFPLPQKVHRALQAIAEVAREHFRSIREGRSMGPLQQAFARRVPFKFANFESATTMSQYGLTRVFRHQGLERQMQRHLTFGGGETNLCLQIYFDFDDIAERVLIGYCGRHLPYTRQRS